MWLCLSANLVRRKFSLSIDICRYSVRDMVSSGVLQFVLLRTHLMVADALGDGKVAMANSKSLPSPAHIDNRKAMLGLKSFSFSARSLRA